MNEDQIRLMEQINGQIDEAIIKEITPYIYIYLLIGLAWLTALVDITRSNFKDQNSKLIWILIVTFTAPIGSIIYFMIGREYKAINEVEKDKEENKEVIGRRENHPKREEVLKKNEWF